MSKFHPAVLLLFGLTAIVKPCVAYDFEGPIEILITKYDQYRRSYDAAVENERSAARTLGLGFDMRLILAPSPQFTWYADFGESGMLNYGLLIGADGVSAFSRTGRETASEEFWFGDLALADRSRIPAIGYFLTHGRIGPVQPFNLPVRVRIGVLTGFYYWVALDSTDEQFIDPTFYADHPYFLEDSGGSFLYPHAEIIADIFGVPWSQSISTSEYSSSLRFRTGSVSYQPGLTRRYRPRSDSYRYAGSFQLQIETARDLHSLYVFQESGFVRSELETIDERLLRDIVLGVSTSFGDRRHTISGWMQPVDFSWLQWGIAYHAIIDETRFELAWNDRDIGRPGAPTGGVTLAATTLF
ncbi:MAG: hypothetical protein EA383_16565 [Spirochaetaceae bacterium]|nr:MAG: hypothetical protein EA383_16565 [Spirochaetaceae bacterium]